MAELLGFEPDGWPHSMSQMVYQTDQLAPQEARDIYQTEEYALELKNEIVPSVRTKLDTDGLGDRLFAACRAKEPERDDRQYQTVILGALMMRAAAKIKTEDMQHLRDLVPQIHCNSRFALPLCDEGFRSPGRAQFLAALDHYQAGVPRNYQEPSCFHCGQIERDIGHALLKCDRCKVAWYCDRECQRSNWQLHRPSCVAPEQRGIWINV